MRKILLSIIGILIIICTIFLSYEKINQRKVENNNGMFAIFLEEEKDTGRYQKSNLKTWPTEAEYIINMNKSYCENGSILRWNNETKKLSLKVKGTDKCYVYFDKAEIGSEKHPHLIQTIEDLVRLSNDVNSGKTYAGEYFLLTNDLDFNDASDYEDANSLDFKDINGINGDEALITELTTGSGFIPIGNSSTNSFQGIFDGDNHTIDNLYIKDYGDRTIYVGFFSFVKSANISNLTLSGNMYISKTHSVGGFIGANYGTSKLFNLNNYINIFHESADKQGGTGGLIGVNYENVSVKNCQNYGNIVGIYSTGGIMGLNYSNLIFENSYNKGNIQSVNYSAGGLIGNTNSSTILINKCYNAGKIISNQYASGLIGFVYSNLTAVHSTYILNSYNIGEVESANIAKMYGAQGLLLIQHGNLYIINSFNNEKIITDSADSRGLIWSYSDETVKLFNVYNASNEKYALGVFSSPDNDTVQNAYYIQRENILGSDANFGTAISEEKMRSQTFVDELNNNIESINLREIDETLKDYKLSKWELGSNGYPELVNE